MALIGIPTAPTFSRRTNHNSIDIPRSRAYRHRVRHIVALSGGKDSTCMALALKQREPRKYEFAITPTGRELPAMDDHWRRLECLLGAALIRVPAPTLVDLIIKQRALPNQRMRWCTRMVKIEPFMAYAQSATPATVYVGIRADEVQGDDARRGTDWQGVEGVTQNLPLVRWGWGINKVLEYNRSRGVVVPPRSDCDFCFFQRLGEWWRLWRDHRDRWNEGEALEDFTGHTFRSDQRDTWPASMRGMREIFEKGYTPKGANQIEMEFDIAERPRMCAWCAR